MGDCLPDHGLPGFSLVAEEKAATKRARVIDAADWFDLWATGTPLGWTSLSKAITGAAYYAKREPHFNKNKLSVMVQFRVQALACCQPEGCTLNKLNHY
jgi:hypothetical protein